MNELREGLAQALFQHEGDSATPDGWRGLLDGWDRLLDGEKAYWFEKAECAIAYIRQHGITKDASQPEAGGVTQS